MGNSRFKSGSFTETDQIKRETKKKTESKQVNDNNNQFAELESSFVGYVVDRKMDLSGLNSGNFKVVNGGKLGISGNFTGNIFVAGGKVETSGIFNGNIIITRGRLEMSGIKSGTIRYLGGKFEQSGINNLQMLY